MIKKEKIIKEMKDILEEAMSLDDEITIDNFYNKYCEAVDVLDIADGEEDEEGELDLHKTIYSLGNDFFDLKKDLRAILESEGLDIEQRKEFYKKAFTF